jgi:glycine dehydrogenase subunit 1
MLRKIGVKDFDELIATIPESVRLKKPLELPEKLSEFEIIKTLEEYASENITAKTHTCFMGGGAYDHFTPTIVQSVLERPEFKTAYTPYQAEVSQGTLQSMYEFQSMICALTGMDVANASLYDGGSALAEACLMAHNQNRKHKIMLAGTINPFYRQVVDTICTAKDLEFHTFIAEDGSADLEALKNAIDDDTSAVVVQQPNAYGSLEDVEEIEKIVHSTKALYIVSVDPVSLGLITPPGDYGADVVVGEGQPLGIPMNFGGPYLGLFACRKKYVRKVPGRLSGVTEDIDGNRGFVLTLQTREQQIKRERATSNICTNQGLIMLAATVYMAAMGKQGLSEVAEQSFRRAHYLAEKIKEIPGFDLAIDRPFFCEFLVETPVPAKEIIDKMAEKGILAGIDTSRFEDCMEGLLVAVTEKRTREEMDRFAEELKQFSK